MSNWAGTRPDGQPTLVEQIGIASRGYRRLRRRRVSASLVLLLFLANCAGPSTSSYDAAEVGQVINTARGTVLMSREVTVQNGENSGAGAVAGGAVGASIGNLIGSSGGSIVAMVVLGLVGVGMGLLAEKEVRNQEGFEYLIRTDDGRIVTLVQSKDDSEEPLPEETRVLLQFGANFTRVVELPSSLEEPNDGLTDDWQNPDLLPGSLGASLLNEEKLR